MSWGLFIPKGWSIVATMLGAFLAGLRFSDTVTLGSVLAAATVVILSGIFTLRNNLKSFWRGLAEERLAQVEMLQEQLVEKEKRLEAFAEEQRALRHELKDKLATISAQLEVERAKTDLSALSLQMQDQHREAMRAINDGVETQKQILSVFTRAKEDIDGTQDRSDVGDPDR